MNDSENTSGSPPSREELEARVLALLLGEADPAERTELEALLAEDPQLQAYHEQMEQTLGLAGEASRSLWNPAQSAPAQLSEDRRTAIREAWGEPAAGQESTTAQSPSKPISQNLHPLIPLGLAAGLAILLGGVWLPRQLEKSQADKVAFQAEMPSVMDATTSAPVSITSTLDRSGSMLETGEAQLEAEKDFRSYDGKVHANGPRDGRGQAWTERDKQGDRDGDGVPEGSSEAQTAAGNNLSLQPTTPSGRATLQKTGFVDERIVEKPAILNGPVPSRTPAPADGDPFGDPFGDPASTPPPLPEPEPAPRGQPSAATLLPETKMLADEANFSAPSEEESKPTATVTAAVAQGIGDDGVRARNGLQYRGDFEKEKAKREERTNNGPQPFGNNEQREFAQAAHKALRLASEDTPDEPHDSNVPVVPLLTPPPPPARPAPAPSSQPAPTAPAAPAVSALPAQNQSRPTGGKDRELLEEEGFSRPGHGKAKEDQGDLRRGWAQDAERQSVRRDQLLMGDVGFDDLASPVGGALGNASRTSPAPANPTRSPAKPKPTGIFTKRPAPVAVVPPTLPGASNAGGGAGGAFKKSPPNVSEFESVSPHPEQLDLLQSLSENLASADYDRERRFKAQAQKEALQLDPGRDRLDSVEKLDAELSATLKAQYEAEAPAPDADGGRPGGKLKDANGGTRWQDASENKGRTAASASRSLSRSSEVADLQQAQQQDVSKFSETEVSEALARAGEGKGLKGGTRGPSKQSAFQLDANEELGVDPGELEGLDSIGDELVGKREGLRKNLERQAVAGLAPDNAPVLDDDKDGKKDVGIEVPVQLPEPKPEVVTAENRWSTFSLNVSDASFRLCEASLRHGQLPPPHQVRAEEFINAFDYRDPAPTKKFPLAFAWERSRHPFAHNRDLVRFSIQTAAVGREGGQALNLVLAIDNSGSMERADRVAILREALKVLATKLRAGDTVSVVAFSRTPRLWIDGQKGAAARKKLTGFTGLVPQGGTNIESALDLGYRTALKHFIPGGNNRLILLTDGAANLGAIVPKNLRRKVESYRKRGVALDCFGIGWDGYNDHLMEALARNGDGRYAFLNSAADVERDFARKLAGALSVSAADVKVQVVFNPARVKTHRQVGYLRHQLKKEDFRNNTVDAAEIGAAESGNAVYVLQINEKGTGPIGHVHVRYREPATGRYKEMSWPLPHRAKVPSLAEATPAMRLAASSATFAEWLGRSPFAADVELPEVQTLLRGLENEFPSDSPVRNLQQMVAGALRITPR